MKCATEKQVLQPHTFVETLFTYSKRVSEPTNVRARLVVPFFRNLFFVLKKASLTGFLRIFYFPVFSWGIFCRNVVLERSQEFLFSVFTEIFCRNSCGTRIPVFTPLSSGFLRIPEDSCYRHIICSRRALPQLALPPASPLCRSALESSLKGSQAVVVYFI